MHRFCNKEAADIPDFSQNQLPPNDEAFEWALSASRERNYSEAAQRWNVLRKAYPDHPAPWFQGVNAYIDAGETEAATTLLNEASERFPENPNRIYCPIKMALQSNDWETAENLIERARTKFPRNFQTWMKSAEHDEAQGNFEAAAGHYLKAAECAPENPAPLVQRAELAMRTKQWEKAISRWETVRKRFPDVRAGYLRAAEAAHQLGQFRLARNLTLTHQFGDELLEGDNEIPLQKVGRDPRQTSSWLIGIIWTKALLNLRSEVQRNYLSYSWWILEPLMHMVVYYVVFGLLLKRGGDNYPLFLLTGLVPWMWFSKSVSTSNNSILVGQNLMLQTGLPSFIFPLVRLLQATIKQFPVFILLLGFVWLLGHSPGAQWLALIPVVIVQALLTIAFACTVAAVIPFVRDLAYLVPTGLTFLMFLSGIFYDYRNIAGQWQELFLLNPIAFILKCYREILIENTWPDMVALAWWGVGSALSCSLLLLAYNRLRYVYPKIVAE